MIALCLPMSYNSKIMFVSTLYVIPSINYKLAKLVTCNSQNYASTLGSGLSSGDLIETIN